MAMASLLPPEGVSEQPSFSDAIKRLNCDYRVASHYLQHHSSGCQAPCSMSTIHRQELCKASSSRVEAELGPSTHHHANLCVCFVIYSLVQHNVHELVKASQGACDLPIAIQGHCQPA